jgi:SSS family solute:Na+ symporter
MNMLLRIAHVFAILASLGLSGLAVGSEVMRWEHMPELPDTVGLAGPFAGVSNGALIVAGGANFPGGRPWDGHPKVWHDRVYVLAEPYQEWRIATTTLPAPCAYGVSGTWRDKVVCLGGGDAERHHAGAFTIEWTGDDVVIERLPPLPGPTAFACGAVVGDTVYVAGGIDEPGATAAARTFWSLDLSDDTAGWRTLEPWPGPERMLATAGSHEDAFYLFSGIRLEPDTTNGAGGGAKRIKPYLSDAYRFTPATGDWTQLADLPRAVAAAPSPAVNVGPSHMLILGGDDGSLPGVELGDEHPGFAGEIFAYHTITGTWTSLGSTPKDTGPDPARRPEAGTWPPVTTPTVIWPGGAIVPTGEIRPGVRTTKVLRAEITLPTPRFGALNYTVLIVYLAGLVGMGFYFSRREKSTADFFLGGRRVPAWAAGVSIFGTQLSAITFLAIPAKTYATDWLYFIQNLGIVAIAPVVVCLYLPFFRRLNVTTAYEYLEHRFNLGLRLFGSASFVAFQLARMGIVMFLPALALSAVTGMDIRACILVMGVLCTLYTVLGGIEAVIWTDVLQVFVLLGGAVVALGIVITGVDGGLAEILTLASNQHKLRMVDLSWDWTGPAIGVILLGAVFNNLVPYTTDQAVVQRYLTTRDERRAARAVWIGAWLSVPASLVFFFMGTALFAFYTSHPDRLNPAGANDQVFAWFIIQELPAGVAGLVIAGVFAAAMSSLDSSMNSIATAITTDFYRRFRADRTERHYLRLARTLTLLLGVAGTATALLMAGVEIKSLWDQFLSYVGLLGGTLAGLFALGIFSTRASAAGAVAGVLGGAVALVYAKFFTPLSGLAYASVGVGVCFTVGWVASIALPAHRKPIAGLTARTLRDTGAVG